MGNMDEADAELALQAAQLGAHPEAQEWVERGQRFVEQQDLRLGDERAGECHALLLAARQLGRQAVTIIGHRHQIEQRIGASMPRGTIHAAHF